MYVISEASETKSTKTTPDGQNPQKALQTTPNGRSQQTAALKSPKQANQAEPLKPLNTHEQRERERGNSTGTGQSTPNPERRKRTNQKAPGRNPKTETSQTHKNFYERMPSYESMRTPLRNSEATPYPQHMGCRFLPKSAPALLLKATNLCWSKHPRSVG